MVVQTKSDARKKNWCQGHGCPKLIVHMGARLEMTEKRNAGHDRKVSGHTVHHSCSHRPKQSAYETPVHCTRGSVMLCWETLGSGIHVALL